MSGLSAAGRDLLQTARRAVLATVAADGRPRLVPICYWTTAGEPLVIYSALDEKPNIAEALLNLGHALMALGQEDEAKSYWRKAIREKPELAQMYFEPAVA